MSCECGECVDAEECGCQDPSELTDDVGNKVFAYSRRVDPTFSASAPIPLTYLNAMQGLFNFSLPSGTEAIECNAVRLCSAFMRLTASHEHHFQSCSCDDLCPNRVAQLPRDVPIEVFRTRERGWGARATVPLPRGKVVGIYTGLEFLPRIALWETY